MRKRYLDEEIEDELYDDLFALKRKRELEAAQIEELEIVLNKVIAWLATHQGSLPTDIDHLQLLLAEKFCNVLVYVDPKQILLHLLLNNLVSLVNGNQLVFHPESKQFAQILGFIPLNTPTGKADEDFLHTLRRVLQWMKLDQSPRTLEDVFVQLSEFCATTRSITASVLLDQLLRRKIVIPSCNQEGVRYSLPSHVEAGRVFESQTIPMMNV